MFGGEDILSKFPLAVVIIVIPRFFAVNNVHKLNFCPSFGAPTLKLCRPNKNNPETLPLPQGGCLFVCYEAPERGSIE